VIDMAEIKDKIVTVESLKTLHEHNENTYETKANVVNLGNKIGNLLDAKFDKPENNIVPIENGGTNSANGATGLANLFADGATVLSSYQYGDELPAAGTVGRIFFKRLTNV
jgi:hypothetical protein